MADSSLRGLLNPAPITPEYADYLSGQVAPSGDFGRGVAANQIQSKAGDLYSQSLDAELQGNQPVASNLRSKAAQTLSNMPKLPTQGLGWAAGQLGELAPSLPGFAASALIGRGIGGVAGRLTGISQLGKLGELAGAYRPGAELSRQAAITAQEQDPGQMQATPQARAAAAERQGMLGGALGAVPISHALGSAVGGGLRRGLFAGAGVTAAENAAASYLQTAYGQHEATGLNPNRDTSQDEAQRTEAAESGGLGGLGMHVAFAVPGLPLKVAGAIAHGTAGAVRGVGGAVADVAAPAVDAVKNSMTGDIGAALNERYGEDVKAAAAAAKAKVQAGVDAASQAYGNIPDAIRTAQGPRDFASQVFSRGQPAAPEATPAETMASNFPPSAADKLGAPPAEAGAPVEPDASGTLASIVGQLRDMGSAAIKTTSDATAPYWKDLASAVGGDPTTSEGRAALLAKGQDFIDTTVKPALSTATDATGNFFNKAWEMAKNETNADSTTRQGLDTIVARAKDIYANHVAPAAGALVDKAGELYDAAKPTVSDWADKLGTHASVLADKVTDFIGAATPKEDDDDTTKSSYYTDAGEPRKDLDKLVWDHLTDTAKQNPAVLDKLPDLTKALANTVEDGTASSLSAYRSTSSIFKDPEAFEREFGSAIKGDTKGAAAARSATSAEQDAAKPNSFIYNALSDTAKDTLSTGQLARVGALIDQMPHMSKSAFNAAQKKLIHVFPSKARAQQVMDYYKNEFTAKTEQSPKYDHKFDEEAPETTSPGDNTDEAGNPNIPPPHADDQSEISFKDQAAARPFFAGEDMTSAKAKAQANGFHVSELNHADYADQFGLDHESEATRLVSDAANRLEDIVKKGQAPGVKPEHLAELRQRYAALKPKLDLMHKVMKADKPTTVIGHGRVEPGAKGVLQLHTVLESQKFGPESNMHMTSAEMANARARPTDKADIAHTLLNVRTHNPTEPGKTIAHSVSLERLARHELATNSRDHTNVKPDTRPARMLAAAKTAMAKLSARPDFVGFEKSGNKNAKDLHELVVDRRSGTKLDLTDQAKPQKGNWSEAEQHELETGKAKVKEVVGKYKASTPLLRKEIQSKIEARLSQLKEAGTGDSPAAKFARFKATHLESALEKMQNIRSNERSAEAQTKLTKELKLNNRSDVLSTQEDIQHLQDARDESRQKMADLAGVKNDARATFTKREQIAEVRRRADVAKASGDAAEPVKSPRERVPANQRAEYDYHNARHEAADSLIREKKDALYEANRERSVEKEGGELEARASSDRAKDEATPRRFKDDMEIIGRSEESGPFVPKTLAEKTGRAQTGKTDATYEAHEGPDAAHLEAMSTLDRLNTELEKTRTRAGDAVTPKEQSDHRRSVERLQSRIDDTVAEIKRISTEAGDRPTSERGKPTAPPPRSASPELEKAIKAIKAKISKKKLLTDGEEKMYDAYTEGRGYVTPAEMKAFRDAQAAKPPKEAVEEVKTNQVGQGKVELPTPARAKGALRELTPEEIKGAKLDRAKTDTINAINAKIRKKIPLTDAEERVYDAFTERPKKSKNPSLAKDGASGERDKNSTYVNKGAGPPEKLDPEVAKGIREEAARSLGPDVAVHFNDMLGEKAGTYTPSTEETKAFIKIAVGSTRQMQSAGWHESAHHLFNTLGKMAKTPVARAMHRDLKAAVMSPSVQLQLRTLLKDHPSALDQLHDPDESMAYAYQFWRQGEEDGKPLLSLQPGGQRWFAAIRDFIYNVLGVMSKTQKVEKLFAAFHEGDLADPDTIDAAINDLHANTIRDRMDHLAPGLGKAYDALLMGATDRLRSFGYDSLDHLTDKFNKDTDREWGGLGFMQRQSQIGGIFRNKYQNGLGDATNVQMATALKNMQAMREPSSPLEQHLRNTLDQMFRYMQNAGVHVKEGDEWVPLSRKHFNENYFPRVWDRETIDQSRPELRSLLIKEGNMKRGAADRLIDSMVGGDGLLDTAQTERHLGFMPANSALNKRVLDFITPANAEKFAKFQSQNLSEVMQKYFYQAVHRAEHTRSFGYDGSVIDDALAQAKKEGMREEDLKAATKTIQALEGTLGHDFNPQLRKLFMGATAYENIALLPFATLSSLSDAAGVSLRSNDFKDQFRAMELGIKGITTALTRGQEGNPNLLARARQFGIIDSLNMLENYGPLYNSSFMSSTLRRINDKFFQYNGMETWNRQMRLAGFEAGQNFVLRAVKGLSSEKIGEVMQSDRYLRELGLKPDDVKHIKPGTGGDMIDFDSLPHDTMARMQAAMYRFVDGAVLRPTAAHMPVWASDPAWMLVAHLKRFSFGFQNTFIKRFSHELGNENMKAAPLFLSFLPYGIFSGAVRRSLTGAGAFTGMTVRSILNDGSMRSGMQGTGMFLNDAIGDVHRGKLPGTSFLGPVAEHIQKALEFITGGPETGKQLLLRSTPLSPLVKDFTPAAD